MEARALIEASGLQASFLNVLSYYLDDLVIHSAGPLRQRNELLVLYDRSMCWIDPAEFGEAVASVLAAPAPEASCLLHLNNGEEPVLFARLAEMLNRALESQFAMPTIPPPSLRKIGPMLAAMTGDPEAAIYLLADWQFERKHRAF